MPNTPEKKTPRDVLRTIFRRKALFLLGASLFAIVAMVGSHYVPLKYTGEARFERRLDSSESSQKNQNEIEAMRLTLELNLVGTQAVQAAIESLGLDRGFPRGSDGKLTLRGEMDRQEKVKELTKGLLVKWEGKSSLVDVISVSFTSSDPLLAERLPNELIRNYIGAEGDRIQARLKQSMDALESRVAECDVRLKEATTQQLAFETEHAGMLPEDPGALQRSMEQITSDIEVVRRQQAVAQTKISRLKAFQTTTTTATATTATTGPSSKPAQEAQGPNPDVRDLQNQLQEARHQLDVDLTVSRMTKEHPTVIMLNKKIALLEKQIAEAPRGASPTVSGTGQTVVDDLAIQLSAAQAEMDVAGKDLERLQDRLSKCQAMMANFGPVRQKYLEIVKKHQDIQNEYSQWNKSYMEVQMELSSEVAKTRTHLESIQAAEPQIRPSFPSLYMVLALAIGGGLAFGAALVFLANALDRSITATEQATEHFELAVFGAVNEIVTTRDQRVRRFRRYVVIPAVSAAVLATIALSGLSVFLWLDNPMAFKEWKAAPITFVFHHLTGSTGGWWGF